VSTPTSHFLESQERRREAAPAFISRSEDNVALDSLSVGGFLSIARISEVELRPVNVIIGANGSGKSNFVRVFSFLNAIRRGRLQEYVAKAGGADQVLHFGSKHTQTIEVHAKFNGEKDQYKIVLARTESDELVPIAESAYFWGDKRQYTEPYEEHLYAKGKEAGISDPEVSNVARYVREALKSWRLYHFHDTSDSSPMKKTSDLDDNSFLRPDGSNLSAFLYYLKAKHRDSYQLIRGVIRRVAPFFDDFLLEPNRLNPDKIRLEWRHQHSENYFNGASLSDGTLRFSALATLFLQPEDLRPSVIVIDEPELGLHPLAITLLASLIKAASEKTQVIVSTQSSLLLDHFEPEDVLVAERIDDGTQLTRLESDKLKQWLEDYSLGQLWEKNEIGGRPSRG
jgi:predicted ATPase